MGVFLWSLKIIIASPVAFFLRCVYPLIFSLDFHRFFAKKLASSTGIPFKNGVGVHSIRRGPRILHKRCSWKFFFIFRIKVKKIFQTTMTVRVRMIFMRKTTSLQAILGIRTLRAIATVCVFLFVCLSNRFYQTIFASHVDSIDMNIRIQWNLVTIFYHQMKMLFVIVAHFVTEPLIDEM